MRFNAHLNFSGDCEEAFRLYQGVLGGKILTMMTYADSPMADQVSAGWEPKILHAALETSGQLLMGCDAPRDRYQKPQGFAVAIGTSDSKEAERIFHELSEGGTVQMPLQETFWAERFGMFVDKFGIPWMVNCGKNA